MEDAKKVKRESDRNRGETRVNGRHTQDGEHRCCVKVCSLTGMCLPIYQYNWLFYSVFSQHWDQAFYVQLGFSLLFFCSLDSSQAATAVFVKAAATLTPEWNTESLGESWKVVYYFSCLWTLKAKQGIFPVFSFITSSPDLLIVLTRLTLSSLRFISARLV